MKNKEIFHLFQKMHTWKENQTNIKSTCFIPQIFVLFSGQPYIPVSLLIPKVSQKGEAELRISCDTTQEKSWKCRKKTRSVKNN